MLIRSVSKDDLSIGENYFCMALALVFVAVLVGRALYVTIGQ